MSEPTLPGDAERRRLGGWAIALISIAVLSVVIVGLLSVIWVRHDRAEERMRESPSFQYGMGLMLHQVYGTTRGISVDKACRQALADPPNPPAPLDLARAVAGCKYQEFLLDN
jgi:hypothetical protein